MTEYECEEAMGLLRSRKEILSAANDVQKAPHFEVRYPRASKPGPGYAGDGRVSVLSVINLTTHLREILLAEYRIRLAENELELRKLGVEPPETEAA